jgi:hypothetical protein
MYDKAYKGAFFTGIMRVKSDDRFARRTELENNDKANNSWIL